ncbi:hypothetical protein O6H91_05G087700 [Diphasiastrum complanatum]|uniref:Uncharacterized protein n=1 Tax=Diphasiastrum complanatum TaxID=34168 RepID=A0ACC2DQH3_DIPCM|nr:hypothetical protein O6H91_05G087700 [Diphasiastrum complanatum]
MGSLISRCIFLVLGYIYPAYICFKSLEHNPKQERLLFWCQYWMIVAVFTVFERIGDVLISWLPLYYEAKIAFVLYLWHPNMKGAPYIYGTFVKPYLTTHEREIDRTLNELKTRTGDMALSYWQSVAMLSQSKFLKLLRVASQRIKPAKNTGRPKPSLSIPPLEEESPLPPQEAPTHDPQPIEEGMGDAQKEGNRKAEITSQEAEAHIETQHEEPKSEMAR